MAKIFIPGRRQGPMRGLTPTQNFATAAVAVFGFAATVSAEIISQGAIVYQTVARAPQPPPTVPTAVFADAPTIVKRAVRVPAQDGFVAPPTAPAPSFGSGSQTQVTVQRTVINQSVGFVSPPPSAVIPVVPAISSDLVFRRTVIYQSVAAVFPPVPVVNPVVPSISSDLFFQQNVIYQSAGFVSPPVAVTPPGLFSAQAELSKKPTRIEQPGFVAVPAVYTQGWASAQAELLKKPTRIEQPGFVFLPPTVVTPVFASDLGKPRAQPRMFDQQSIAPQQISTIPSALSFSQDVARAIGFRVRLDQSFVAAPVPPLATWQFIDPQQILPVRPRAQPTQDWFVTPPFVQTYSFSSDPPLKARVAPAQLQDPFVAPVIAPTFAFSGGVSTEIILFGAIINQMEANVVQPPPVTVGAFWTPTQVELFRRPIIKIEQPGFVSIPAGALSAPFGDCDTDIAIQAIVIYQPTGFVFVPPVVTPPSVFASPDIVLRPAQRRPAQDGFVSISVVTYTWGWASEALTVRPLPRQSALPDQFVSAPPAAPPALFSTQIELFKKPTRVEQQAGFVSIPVVYTQGWASEALAARRLARPGVLSDPFVSTQSTTPSAFWFGAQVELRKRPTRIEQPGFVSVPVVTYTQGWASEALARRLSRPVRIDQPGFTVVPPPTIRLAFSEAPQAAFAVTLGKAQENLVAITSIQPYFNFAEWPTPYLGRTAIAVPDGAVGVAPVPPPFVVSQISSDLFFQQNIIYQANAVVPKPAPPAVSTVVSAISTDIVRQRTVIYQSNAGVLPPVPGPPTPANLLSFADQPTARLGTERINVPDGLSVITTPPITVVFSEQPKAGFVVTIGTAQQSLVVPPVIVPFVASQISSDLFFQQNVIYQANAVVPQPAPPAVVTVVSAISTDIVRQRTVIYQSNAGVIPPPPIVVLNFAGGVSTEIVSLGTIINQMVANVVQPPQVGPSTPTNWWSSEHLAPTLRVRVADQVEAAFQPPPVTPSFWPWSPSPDAIKKPTRIEQPWFTFIAPGVPTPSNWWTSEAPVILRIVPRFLADPFVAPVVAPTTLVFSGDLSTEIISYGAVIYQMVANVVQPPQVGPLTPSNWWTPEQPIATLRVRVSDQFEAAFPPPAATLTPSFWPWSPSPERLIKPKPLLTPSADISFLQIAYTPSFWAWSSSPERIIKPRPLLTPSADISFLQIAYTPTFWPWSPSPERIIKPRPLLTPSADISFQLPTPTFWSWSPSPERIIKPRPLLTPSADISFLQIAYTPGPLVFSPSPDLLKKPTRVEQPGYFTVFPPPVPVPAFFPWSASPEIWRRGVNIVLQQHTGYVPRLPPEVVIISPPGGGKRRFRRPHGAQKLERYQRVIYRSDDYGLRFPVPLFESLEREPEPQVEARAPAVEEAPAPTPVEAPRFERRVVGPSVDLLRRVFGSVPTQAEQDQQDVADAMQAIGQLGDPMVNQIIDQQDAIDALTALNQLDDPMFNLIIEYLIKILKDQ